MTNQKKLEKLNRKIKKCKKCLLYKTRKNTVPGEGPVRAKIMIVGQAPGDKEDKTGRPFVGRAGQLLNQLLELAGIKREKVFITSPIKCFPHKNRKPTKKEIAACSSYLKEQIKTINPKKFILLGEVAFKVFFPNEKLKDFRGKWITLRQAQGEKKFFITYHPAAGLRFQKIRTRLQRDFVHFRQNLDSHSTRIQKNFRERF